MQELPLTILTENTVEKYDERDLAVFNVLAEAGITQVETKFTHSDYMKNKFRTRMDRFKVYITHDVNRDQIEFDYSMGEGLNMQIDITSIFYSLVSDYQCYEDGNDGYYEDLIDYLISEFDYEYKAAKETAKALKTQYAKVSVLFNEEQIEALQKILEDY